MVNFTVGLVSGDFSNNTSTDANENESVVDVHHSGLGDCSSNTSTDANESKFVVEAHSPKRLCLVCGDVASGFHYGVASCEACKAFFKRTIQGNIEYQCPASNDCEINKRRRKACQACRFQKCLKMGMLKEGVRLDRVRGGRQKYRRTLENSSLVQPANIKSRRTSLEGTSYNNHNGAMLNPGGNSPPCLLTDNKIIVALMNCEPDPLSLPANATSTSNFALKSAPDCGGINALSDLVDKELVATICWAKNIPGFMDLILNDQMRLLQATWGEILALSLAYRSQSCFFSSSWSSSSSSSSSPPHLAQVPQKLYFSSDFVMDESMAVQFKADEMFSLLLQLTRRLAGLHLTKEEFMVLKALLLTNVDVLLEDAPAVLKMRETLLSCLHECSNFNPPYNSSVHFGQVLLSLPLLRQVDGAIRRFWAGVRKEGKVSMNKLFIEMLESNITIK